MNHAQTLPPRLIGLLAVLTLAWGFNWPMIKLAIGGMAEIYLARQTGVGGFKRLVVVKKILPHLVRQERFVQMFFDEARIAAVKMGTTVATNALLEWDVLTENSASRETMHDDL